MRGKTTQPRQNMKRSKENKTKIGPFHVQNLRDRHRSCSAAKFTSRLRIHYSLFLASRRSYPGSWEKLSCKQTIVETQSSSSFLFFSPSLRLLLLSVHGRVGLVHDLAEVVEIRGSPCGGTVLQRLPYRPRHRHDGYLFSVR